jgi:beta-glucanase (GH16 family)
VPTRRITALVALLAALCGLLVVTAPAATSAPSGWRDDFSTFNDAVWNKINWGCFDTRNVSVSNGLLGLRIVPDSRPDCFGVVGARVNTVGKRSFASGTFTARIKFVTAPGSWQTFWLTGDNGKPFPAAGEVDIAEITGRSPSIAHHRLHSSKIGKPLKRCSQGGDPVVQPDGRWRTYSATTSGTRVVFRVDGNVVGRYQPNGECTWPYGDPMHIVLSARGGQYGGTVVPSRYPVTYYVDWVSWEPLG